MLPIILQHVRELAEVHVAAPERGRNKIITPFPPIGQDFAEFEEDDLAFRDLPPDASSASLDTIHAYEFFKRTDSLYYDYSYGIKSDEFLLSHICERFLRTAKTRDDDLAFDASFDGMRDAFLHRYNRVTAGDLGNLPFKYTSLSPISWSPERVVLNAAEIERLKQKAIAVYEDLEPGSVGFLNALIEEVKVSNYSSIAYELGFFDVIREWMDPRLFESPYWEFPSGTRTLYGEGDPTFADNVKLCYAQRFYLIREYTATARPTPQPKPPDVSDDRPPVIDRGLLHDRLGAVRLRDSLEAAAVVRDRERSEALVRETAESPVNLRRRALRNVLIHGKVESMTALPMVIVAPRPRVVWAGAVPQPVPEPPPSKPGFKIAALKCRLLSQTP